MFPRDTRLKLLLLWLICTVTTEDLFISLHMKPLEPENLKGTLPNSPNSINTFLVSKIYPNRIRKPNPYFNQNKNVGN